jgi:TonB family protein
MGLENNQRRPILSQSLFNTIHTSSSSWGSYTSSGVAHAILILALLLITVPVLRNDLKKQKVDTVTLIAPPVPEYQPRIAPHTPLPSPVSRNEIRPKPLAAIKPVEVKPLEAPKPKIMAAAPAVKTVTAPPTPQPPLPELKLAPAPKPAVRTGTFQTADAAKAPQTPKVTKVGGFGDPNGVLPSPNSQKSDGMLAKVGSFDLANGGGNAGGGGKNSSGGIRQTSFGSAGEPGGAPSGTGRGSGKVQTGGFGETPISPEQAAPVAHSQPATPAFTPVEILSKPKPVYTAEARNLRLEGQVSLDVVFQATGTVKIIRVVHGLGHGLDEAAEQAALQVRFRPAMRGGVPVDTTATIHITFELT